MLPISFKKNDAELLERKTAFKGFFQLDVLRLRHKLFRGGWSEPMEREVFVRRDAAAAVVYDPQRDLIGLVEQFRAGALQSRLSPWCLEGVAGMVESGETPDDLIRRELQEEAGIASAQLIPITAFYNSPGGCDEYTHLFCALADLSQGGGHYGLAEEHEDIRFHVVAAEEVFASMYHDRCDNASTLIGLQWLQWHRPQLQRARQQKD